jgi:flagellar biosynthesis protein FlhB
MHKGERRKVNRKDKETEGEGEIKATVKQRINPIFRRNVHQQDRSLKKDI